MTLGIIAAILFGVAYIFNGAGFHGNDWIGPTPFLFLGLFCLALHGLGASDWLDRRRNR